MQGFKNLVPPLSGKSQFQECLQALALWPMDYENIHAGGVRRIMKPLYKPRGNKGIQGFSDQLHVASHKSGDLLAGQERSRMPVQENQQIEITAVSDYRSASEQLLNLFWIVAFVGRCRNNSLWSRLVTRDSSANRRFGIIPGIVARVLDASELKSVHPGAG